ncbi:hypothetical protein FBU30_009455 [Linnemannia zychae]|nr:hypothetical protein FBU30_009455 [Linnemannia zychae]
MATNQPVSQLAVSIPVAPSTGAAPVRYSEPQSTSVPVSSVVMTGSTPVSTPTSGMHSPPLSGTLEEEANEKQAAHNAASQSQKPESGKRTTPSLTMTTPPPTLNAPAAFSNSNSKKSVISNNSCLEAEKRNSPSVTASQTQKSTPNVKITPAKDQPDMRSLMTHGGGDRTHDSALSVLPVGSRTAVNDRSRPDVYQARRLQNKQKTIEHVLQQGKILKV